MMIDKNVIGKDGMKRMSLSTTLTKIVTTATTIASTGNLMGVGGGVGDSAVDVTYSTKPEEASPFGGMTTSKVISPVAL